MRICYALRVRSEVISQVIGSRFIRPAYHSERQSAAGKPMWQNILTFNNYFNQTQNCFHCTFKQALVRKYFKVPIIRTVHRAILAVHTSTYNRHFRVCSCETFCENYRFESLYLSNLAENWITKLTLMHAYSLQCPPEITKWINNHVAHASLGFFSWWKKYLKWMPQTQKDCMFHILFFSSQGFNRQFRERP